MARLPGVPNKSTMRVAHICEIRGYDSIESMINAAEIAMARFIEDTEKENSGRISPMESKAAEYLKIYVKIACDIAKFIHPQRKAIDIKQADPTEGMTPLQRLEAMKQAVAMLELKVKGNE